MFKHGDIVKFKTAKPIQSIIIVDQVVQCMDTKFYYVHCIMITPHHVQVCKFPAKALKLVEESEK